MLDTVTEMVDTAAGLLGGDDGAAGDKLTGTPEYTRGESLEPADGGDDVATAPQNVNALDQGPIEFVHFGRAHADVNTRFVHGDLEDGAHPLESDSEDRAIRFRAALERETLLLHGFANSFKEVLTEYEANQGGLGDLAGAAMDLLSGDEPSGPAKPTAADLDAHLADIATCGGMVNQAEIKYLDIHTAGVDLHQFRADYVAFAEEVHTQYALNEGGEAAGGGGLGGMLPEMPGVTGALKTGIDITFKAFDIYVAMFCNLQKTYESKIEDACYRQTIKAIREQFTPVYAVWFPQPEVAADNTGQGDGSTNNANPNDPAAQAAQAVNEQIDKVENAIQDVQDKAGEVRDDIRGFMGFEDDPEPTFGDDEFNEIFGLFAEKEEDGAPVSAARAFTTGFNEALGIDELPGVVNTVISEITTINVGVLKRVYKAIQLGGAGAVIDEASILKVGREEMSDSIVRLAAELIGTDLTDPDRKLLSLSPIGDFGGEQVGNLASGLLDDALGAQLQHIIDLTMKDLGARLEAARKQASDENALTMEVFYGMLPWLLALQVRNTFFPFWDLLVKYVFGSLTGPINSMMSPINNVLGTASDVVNDVKQVTDTVNNVTDKLAEGVDLIDAAKDPGAFADSLMGGDDPTGGGSDAPPPAFPGSPRETKGSGVAITLADVEEAGEVTLA